MDTGDDDENDNFHLCNLLVSISFKIKDNHLNIPINNCETDLSS